jgi:serine/threonine protein kinase
MYQMLTGTLPYDTPAPADLGKLMSGELVSSPRLINPAIPRGLSGIILKAMAPDVTQRYQRASDLLEDVLNARTTAPGRRTPQAGTPPAADHQSRLPREDAASLHSRLRHREPPGARFCWHCRKPLHARADRCPFCGEAQ